MSLSIKKPEQEEGIEGCLPSDYRHSNNKTYVIRLQLENSPRPFDCQFPASVTKFRLDASPDYASATHCTICDTMRHTRDNVMTRLLLISHLLLAFVAVATPAQSVAGVDPQTAGDPLPYDL